MQTNKVTLGEHVIIPMYGRFYKNVGLLTYVESVEKKKFKYQVRFIYKDSGPNGEFIDYSTDKNSKYGSEGLTTIYKNRHTHKFYTLDDMYSLIEDNGILMPKTVDEIKVETIEGKEYIRILDFYGTKYTKYEKVTGIINYVKSVFEGYDITLFNSKTHRKSNVGYSLTDYDLEYGKEGSTITMYRKKDPCAGFLYYTVSEINRLNAEG